MAGGLGVASRGSPSVGRRRPCGRGSRPGTTGPRSVRVTYHHGAVRHRHRLVGLLDPRLDLLEHLVDQRRRARRTRRRRTRSRPRGRRSCRGRRGRAARPRSSTAPVGRSHVWGLVGATGWARAVERPRSWRTAVRPQPSPVPCRRHARVDRPGPVHRRRAVRRPLPRRVRAARGRHRLRGARPVAAQRPGRLRLAWPGSRSAHVQRSIHAAEACPGECIFIEME